LAFLCLGGAAAAPGPAAIDPSFNAQDLSCASSSLCLTIGQSGTTAGTTGQEFSLYNGTTWTSPAATSTLDSSELIALSCAPGTTFCAASDDASGAITYSGGTWSPHATVGGVMAALSCTTSSFCLGLTDQQQQITYNGTSWTVSAGPMIDPTAVSCASTTLCVAIAGTQAAVYDGSTWGAPQTLVESADASSGQALTSVSCAVGTETCVAVDNGGNAYGYDPGTGLVTQSVDDGTPLTSVSCVAGTASAVDCVALDDLGGAVSTSAPTTSGSWSDSVSDTLAPGDDAFVSCTSANTCAAVDTYTDSATTAGPTATSWTSGPTLGSGGFDAVSCAPDTNDYDCVLADGAGRVVVIDGRNVSAPEDVDGDVPLTSLACPSTAGCLAGDADGNIITITGSTSTSHALDPSSGIAAIACPTTSFCDALAYDGDDYTYNGSSWSSATSIDSAANGPDALSCASASFCVATDFAGNAFTFNGSSWSAGTSVDPNDGLDAVSCPTSSYCLAGDEAGAYLSYNGSAWSTPEADLDGSAIYTVECTSANNCALGGTLAIEDDADGQFTIAVGNSADTTDISCSSAAYCMAVDDGGSVQFGAGDPVNTGPPTISGTPVQGDTLTANPGTWLGSPESYTYQWLACTTATQCNPISKATQATYTIPQVTQAESFEVEVIAVNPVGDSSPVTSAATATAAVLAPTDTTAPTVAGAAVVGGKLTAAHGTWYGVGTLAYAYQWYACTKTCTAIATATNSTLTVTPADIGRSLAVVVYATNSAGTSKPSVSQLTQPVAAPAATLAGWLAPLLHLTGSAGQLTPVKRAKDYPVSFRAAIPGAVTVTWTVTEKIAHTKRTRTVTVARASASTTAPSTTLKVKLTKSGIAILKPLKTAKVKATVTFTYAFGSATQRDTATRTLTLSH
jgi:hypothetical protein